MKELTLSTAADLMNAKIFNENIDREIKEVKTDSRQIQPGDLFVALKGERVDGHDCVAEAEARGAIGVVVERRVDTRLPTLVVENTLKALGIFGKAYRQYFQIPIVAVTGSCGKTTVKEMIYSILSLHASTLANIGNLNTEVGVPLTLLRLNDQHKQAVIEMGARKAGDITYLMSLVSPEISLITNAGVAHIEIFGTAKGIAEAKGEIYSELSPVGTAIINRDDPNAVYWMSLLKGQRVFTFGLSSKNLQDAESLKANKNNSKHGDYNIKELINIHGRSPVFHDDSSDFVLITDIGEVAIHLPMPGEHSIQNALAAACVARALNVPLNCIKAGLENFQAATGRLQNKIGMQGARIIDDTYNANPVSMLAALKVLAGTKAKKIFVMGDMFELGKESLNGHHETGLAAKNLKIDKMFGIGEATKAAVEAFGSQATHYVDKAELISALMTELDPNTIVLVKGSRGMRMEEVVSAIEQPKKEQAAVKS